MLSDDQYQSVKSAATEAAGSFHSAVTTTVEQVRGYLEGHGENGRSPGEQFRAELGGFAADIVDVDRFSETFASRGVVTMQSVEAVERAFEVLSGFLGQDEVVSELAVPPGGDPVAEVDRALTRIGRAFGAAHVVELSKTGRYSPDQHDVLLEGLPFQQWTKTERRLTPPLVVRVDGSDLQLAGLQSFLDDGVRLLFLVQGKCSPAPLVGLIAPQTLVIQSKDIKRAREVLDWKGAGVAAAVEGDVAEFVHDPRLGGGLSERLTVLSWPKMEPSRPLGQKSLFQLRQELDHLRSLAALKSGEVTELSSTDAQGAKLENPADRLAAWLLKQADLRNLEEAE